MSTVRQAAVIDGEPDSRALTQKGYEAQRRYEFIVNTSRELMAFVNRDFVYEAVNDAYCQARSQTREEILGSTMAELWGEDVFDAVIRESMERCLAGEEVKYQAWYDHAALGRRYMDVAYYPYRNHRSDVTHAVVVTYDATRYMLAEQETLRYATRLEALQAIDRAILDGQPIEEMARHAAQGLRDLLPEQQTHIVLFEQEREPTEWSGRSIPSASARRAGYQERTATWHIHYPPDMVPRLLAAAPDEPWIYQADEWIEIVPPLPHGLNAETILLRDVHAETHIEAPASFISMPLTSSDTLLGTICVGVVEPHAFSKQHVDIVHDIAYHLALGIQQRRMERAVQRHTTNLEELVEARTFEIERRRRVAEGLRDVLDVLNLSHSLDQIAQRIAEQARDLVDASATAVYMLDRDEETESEPKRPNRQLVPDLTDLSLRAFCGNEEATVTIAVDKASRLAVVDAMYGEPAERAASPHEASTAKPSLRRVLARRGQAQSAYALLLVVPLVLREEALGAIVIHCREYKALTQEEFDVLLALGDQSALAIESAMLYKRAEKAGVLEERGRLARDLHDAVVQSLYSLVLFAEAGRRLVSQDRPAVLESHLGQLGLTAQQALKEMRLLLFDLRPLTLEEEGLVGALQQRLNAVEKRAGLQATIDVEGLPPLAPPVEESLYRIAQEALNNSLKHAYASRIGIELRATTVYVSPVAWQQANGQPNAKILRPALFIDAPDLAAASSGKSAGKALVGERKKVSFPKGSRPLLEVMMTISDNGCGFEMDQMQRQAGGMGLSNIRERVEKLGGEVDIRAAPDKGTRIEVRLLVDEAAL